MADMAICSSALGRGGRDAARMEQAAQIEEKKLGTVGVM